MQPPSCPGRGQDPVGDPETLEAEIAPASNAATRAARPPTTCSMLVTLVVRMAIYWESVWTQLSNLDTLCVSNCSDEGCESISLNLSSKVLEQPPVLSRLGREPSREPKFEDEAGTPTKQGSAHSFLKLARVSHENRWDQGRKLVVDTWETCRLILPQCSLGPR